MEKNLLFYFKHYFDFIFYFIILLALISGLIRGLVKELFKFLAVVLGILISYLFTEQTAVYFSDKFQHSYIVWSIICSIGLYFMTYIIIIIIGHFVSKITEAVELSGFDKIFGGILGLLKGIFITLLIFYVLNFIPDFNKFAEHSVLQKQYTFLNDKYDFSSQLSIMTEKFKVVKKIIDDPETREKLANSDEIKELKKQPEIKNIINDPEIQKDFENKNWSSLLTNKKIVELLKNKKLINKLKNIDFNQYIKENENN